MQFAPQALAAADELLQEYQTRDPFKLCRFLDIAIYQRDNFVELKAMYMPIDGRACIFLKSDLAEQEKALCLAHELGHVRLHNDLVNACRFIEDNTFIDLRNRPEFEANCFAAELLISDEAFLELAVLGHPISQMAAALGWPEVLLRLKAKKLELEGQNWEHELSSDGDFSVF